MLSPLTKKVGGETFCFNPMPSLSACLLDKRVMSLVVPLGGGISLDKVGDIGAMDIGPIVDAVAKVLQNLSDTDMLAIVKDSLAHVTWVSPKEGALPLSDASNIDKAFAGDLQNMYLTLVEVWRYNKLTPFALADHFGGLIQKAGEQLQNAVQKKPGVKLERSAPSTLI